MARLDGMGGYRTSYKQKHKHKQLGERDWMNGMEHESEQGVHGGCQSGRSVAGDR